MTKIKQKDIDFILRSGEGLRIEFKQSPKHIDKAMVAFANAEGGKVYLGIDDHKNLVGVNITNDLKSRIQDIARNCDPQVDLSIETFKKILIVEIKEGKNKPYKCKDGFFMRIGPNSQKMSRNEIIDLVIREGRVFFDDQVNSEYDVKKELSVGAIKRFFELSKIGNALPLSDALVNLGAVVRHDDKLCFNNAGVLFFAKSPQKFLKQANMTCVAFKDKEGVEALDRKDLSGNLLDIVAEAEKFVLRNTRTGFKIKGFQREDLPEYPIEAIREGFVNALMHRDYFEKGASVLLKMFPGKIVIDNPGGLVKGMTVKDLGHKSATRNPLIADLFYRVGLAEKMGSGIKRMRDLMRKCDLRLPKIEVTEDFFTITFYGPKHLEVIIPEVAELNGRQKKALNYVKEKGKITNKEYRLLHPGITDRTALNDLLDMVRKKVLKRVGKTRGARYYLRIPK